MGIGALIKPIAQTLLGQAGAAGLGIALEKRNDERQLRMQDNLSRLGLQMDKQRMDYQNQKQLEMWKATNYSAQVEEMKKAGLSTGLMYGQGGGGGTTVGGGMPTSSIGQAPSGGGEIMGMMQLRSQEAQIELMKAQTEKTIAEADKTKGVDTKLSETQIESLTQGIENQKAVQELTKIESRLNNLELNLKEDTYGDALEQIKYNADKIKEEFKLIRYERVLSGETLENKIKIAEAELINKGLEGQLLKTNSNLGEAKIKEISASIAQKWKALSIDDRNAMTNYINAKTNEFNADTNRKNHYEGVRNNDMGHYDKRGELLFKQWLNDIPESEQQATEVIKGVLQAATLGGAINGGNRNPIGFKKY